MKHVLTQNVRYADVDTDMSLSTKNLFSFLQEAAILHASACGDSPSELMARGNAWVLMKIGVEFLGKAFFGDELTIETWSRGSKGIKAYRDFIVRRGDREICRATTLWVYFDAALDRIVRIPDDLMDRYTVEPELATSIDLDKWKASPGDYDDYSALVSTRTQDYDINRHINNTAYVGFLDSVVSKRLGKPARYRCIKVQYEHEVTPDVEEVTVSLSQSGDFSIAARDRVCVRGEYQLCDC